MVGKKKNFVFPAKCKFHIKTQIEKCAINTEVSKVKFLEIFILLLTILLFIAQIAIKTNIANDSVVIILR